MLEPPAVRFQELMPHRVHRILLVSSLYDSFILAEDGRLSEALLGKFAGLNLGHWPDLTRVSTGAEALALARGEHRFDLIVTSLHVGDMDALGLVAALGAAGLTLPVVVLAYNNRELTDFLARRDASALERVFLWQGDVSILLAIVKSVEDRLNVAHDTGRAGVPVIVVVEDNVRFYSAFLPVLYAEVVRHTQHLVAEGVSLTQKMLRLRARPKILLCQTYEQAWEYLTAYDEHVLGLISDIEFPRGGELDRQAGLALAAALRRIRPDIPLMLQSSFPANAALATSIGASFLLKGSPLLLEQLRRFVVDNLGFDDFVFRLADRTEIDRAGDLKTLEEKLRTLPVESLAYHGERNHFSIWLKARGEFALAHALRPRRVSDFASLEHLRRDLIRAIHDTRVERDRIVVADFDRQRLDSSSRIARIGGGSLGGKARGLAFVNRLIHDSRVEQRFPGVRVTVPEAVVLGTEVFERLLEHGDLREFALRSGSDAETERRFLEAPLPERAREDLAAFLARAPYPLAVRSSGLLEDAPNQPFAGVYQTYMLPNSGGDAAARLEALVTAVQRVYASTFSAAAKRFMPMTPYRLEEERMAVIVQRIVGGAHGSRFYPDFSGVARSIDFYPVAPIRAEDGMAAVALGLGKTVVEGGACLRFCPRYPRHVVSFSTVDDALRHSQREFWALDLASGAEVACELRTAEEDGTLAAVGSTWSAENDAVYDGLSRPGVRLVTFAPVLKHGAFPLAELLDALLRVGSAGCSSPVEIEFAVNLGRDGEPAEFGFLQMRPLAARDEADEPALGGERPEEVLCRSRQVLGHGLVGDVRDLVVVDVQRFERAKSQETARDVARLNAGLQREGLPFALIGVGRWGSSEPYLGIPVTWEEIAGVRVIVEAGLRDLRVEPSQGSHFFQNLSSCNVGYFTVNPDSGDGFVDWSWLERQPVVAESGCVRRLRLAGPLRIRMNGRKAEGVILKPVEAA